METQIYYLLSPKYGDLFFRDFDKRLYFVLGITRTDSGEHSIKVLDLNNMTLDAFSGLVVICGRLHYPENRRLSQMPFPGPGLTLIPALTPTGILLK